MVVIIKILKCKHCNHVWPRRRNKNNNPKVCPRCKSRRWDKLPLVKHIPKSRLPKENVFFGIEDELNQGPNALAVLKQRYLLRDEQGSLKETPKQLFKRVAEHIAKADKKNTKEIAEKFYKIMSNLEFIPNSPTLMNSNTPLGQLSACFILPLHDSLEDIFTTLKNTALIEQCLVPETLIMTNKGLISLQQAKKNMKVTVDKSSNLISNIHYNGIRSVLRVTTEHGYDITGTKNHRLLILDKKTGKEKWGHIKDLKIGDWVILKGNNWINKKDKTLPKFKFVYKKRGKKTSFKPKIFNLPKKLTPELAELIGFYLGDGCKHRDGIRFTVSEKEKDLIKRINELSNITFSKTPTVSKSKNRTVYEVSIFSRQIKDWFNFLGINKKKSSEIKVPKILLSSSKEILYSFLRGFFTTDGCIDKRGYISCSSSSIKFIKTIQLIMLHLGIFTRIYTYNRFYKKRLHPLYFLYICNKESCIKFRNNIGFSCKFKQNRLKKVNLNKIFIRNEIIPYQQIKIKKWYKSLPHGTKKYVSKYLDGVVNRSIPRQLMIESIKAIIKNLNKNLIPDFLYHLLKEKKNKFYTKISEIKPVGSREVLDLTVLPRHTYIANGFITHNSGGGVGMNFSELRPTGDIVRSTAGVASGPTSFARIFDTATEVIKSGGKRRGAMMGILNYNHPDVREFIEAKSKEGLLTNFNLSVGVKDEFFRALEKKESYWLINPRNSKKIEKVNADEIFDFITKNAWKHGDPGIIFLDEINRHNPIPSLKINATNPCGEQDLPDYGSCNLGSINLNKIVENSKINWNKLKELVHIGVHFLDNVIDMNKFPIKKIEEVAKQNRFIGLGIMGFADLLIKLKIPYNSRKALKTAEKLMGFINKEAKIASVELAKQKGSFPNIQKSIWKDYEYLRNASITTVAPTGTISIIAGSVSSGIEPLFAIAFMRHILGTELLEVNKEFEKIAKERGFYSKELMKKISKTGSIQNILEIPADVRKIFVTALDIAPEWHVRMQSAFQKHIDSSISKTVNLPKNATVDDVKKIYLLAYKLKCKGITVYRYGSKKGQVLNIGKTIKVKGEYSGGCPYRRCLF